ncbi:MAG: hypothetical protein ACI4UE_00960 [Candidatus Scatovivens sp.]
MNKKIISMLIILIIIFISNTSYAYILSLNLKCSKENIEVGDEFEIIVDWKDNMQAADFYFYWDNEKVEYLGADIDEEFVQKKDGYMKVAWFSTNNENKNSIAFKFKAIDEGKVKFDIKVDGGFATGSLKQPDKYEKEPLNIQINHSNGLLKIIITLIIILVLIYIIIFRSQRRKR